MALLETINFTTPEGTIVDSLYWRWTELTANVPVADANITLRAYKSEQAFNEGRQPVDMRIYNVSGIAFGTLVLNPPNGDTLSDAISNAIYDYVKTIDPKFANAVNV